MATAPVVEATGTADSALPAVPEDIDAMWLTNVLGHQVKTVEITKVIHGTASKVFATVLYDDDDHNGSTGTIRATFLCIKGGFDPDIIAQYPWIASILHSSHGAAHDGTGQGIVVMDSLNAQGCQFRDPSEPWPVSRVLAGVEQLAALHAGTWNARAHEMGQVLDEYRKSFLAGIGWIMCPYAMQPKEQVHAMAVRYAVRYAVALDDHKTIELVESLSEHG